MLAAGPGTASDVKNSQFGEQFTSLRDLCKRYQAGFKFKEEIPLATLDPNQITGLTPVILTDSSYTFDTLQRHRNALASIAHAYRGIRGGFSYKVKAQFTAVPTDLGTVYQPPVYTDFYVTPFESNQGGINTGNGFQTNFPSDETTQGLHSPRAVPLAYGSPTQVAEFKVPFLSTRTFTLNQQGFDIPGAAHYNRGDFNNQSLVYAFYLHNIPTGHETAYRYYLEVEVIEAFSDETTFGIWVGAPAAYIETFGAAQSCGPDEWLNPSPIPRKPTSLPTKPKPTVPRGWFSA